MKTLQVVNVRWYNATAWYGVTLARCLQNAGHESIVVGLEGTPPLERARGCGLETVALPLNSSSPVKLFESWRGMNALLREFRPDIVNCHRGESFLFWGMLKKKYGYGLVRTRGDRRLPRGGAVNKWLHCSAADAVVATNSLMLGHFRNVMHVPSPQLHLLLGGVDTERFHEDLDARRRMRSEYGFSDDDIVVGLLGRMDAVKGIRETIEALAIARKRSGACTKMRFLVIGFDSEFKTEDVGRWALENGLGSLGGIVTVTGRVEHPEEVVNALDVGILSSLGSEAIARAALEIMATGVPLLSSTTGVMPDLVPEEYTFAPGDVQGMADRLVQAADPGFRAALASVCRRRVLEGRLRLGDFLEDTLEVYENVLKGRNRS